MYLVNCQAMNAPPKITTKGNNTGINAERNRSHAKSIMAIIMFGNLNIAPKKVIAIRLNAIKIISFPAISFMKMFSKSKKFSVKYPVILCQRCSCPFQTS